MVAEEGVQRKRRRRRRRGGGGGGAPQAEPRAQPLLSEWQWRTFPVFFAFAVGMVVMGVLVTTQIGLVVFIVGLFGVAFGVAHIVTRAIVANRRR